jgi:predicted alpha/beta-hydrolase family hydrolase
MDTVVAAVATPLGPGRFLFDVAENPHAMLVLGHGAGGGPNAADLELLAARLPEHGVSVVRFEQPWRTAGRRVAVPPPKLDEAWRAAVGWLTEQAWVQGRLFFGGRSAGARVACRTANEFLVAGVVCLAFPLHLPGRPDKSRAAELAAPTAPRLVLQGGADAFGQPAEVRTAVPDDAGVTVVELPGADHGFRLPKGSPFRPADLRAAVVERVLDFVG